MSATLYRRITENLPVIVSGHGHTLETADGYHLIDFSSGPCCSSLGHSNRFVQDAMTEQCYAIPNVFSGFWASKASEKAGEQLGRMFDERNPGWFGRVIFQQAGGEAVDLACKLAVQYHLEAGQHRLLFAARDHAFHGVGMLPAALSDHYPRYALMEPYRDVIDDLIIRVPHPYDADPDCLIDTEGTLMATPGIGAIIIEPVAGPPLGAWPDPVEYMQELRKLCDRYGVLLIFDEILCGAGRCGYLSVAEYYDVWPDILILGKSLSAGYQPVSAIVMSSLVSERIAGGSGTVMFGTTYGAHSMGCAAVTATLDYLERESLLERVRGYGPTLSEKLVKYVGYHRMVDSIRGLGFLQGVSLHPGGKVTGVHALVREKAMSKGVVIYSKGQTHRGKGDFLIIAPPFEIPDDVVDHSCRIIGDSIEAVWQDLKNG